MKKLTKILPKFNLSLIILFFSFCFNYVRAENINFADTPDEPGLHTIIAGPNDVGFYTQISFFADETVVPKKSLLPTILESKTDEVALDQVIFDSIVKAAPTVVIENKSANCELYQEPYYAMNDMYVDKTELTFQYLIIKKADLKSPQHSGLNNKLCTVKFFVLNQKEPFKTIEFLN